MRFASWICKATNTYSEYVTLIAFPLQQRLDERASMIGHTYSAVPVLFVRNQRGFTPERFKREQRYGILPKCCIDVCILKGNKCQKVETYRKMNTALPTTGNDT